MEEQKKQVLYTQLDDLIEIYDLHNPIGLDKKFDLENVKKTVLEMCDYIIQNKEECAALKKWMDEHDFWKSPASTRFHGDFESGLCVHSLMVVNQGLRFAKTVVENFEKSPMADKFDFTAEDVFVACLCHDFCKSGTYNIEFRNVKDYAGNWTKKPYYKTREDSRNLGHGNESVLLLLETMPSFIKKRYVLEAVSRHMGFSDVTDTEKMNYSNFLQNPLVILIQIADQTASGWWDC
ncbi:MAG: HD domain-containing protein [Treponema sp.]|nr:HD domain-containing protein [Treponema sp.]